MPGHHHHLFTLIEKNDTDAFHEVFYIYGPRISTYIFRMLKKPDLTKDLVQEVFLTLWCKRSGLSSINNPEYWLLQVAQNLCLNEFRRQRSRRNFLSTYEDFIPPNTADEKLHRKLLGEVLEEGIGKLPAGRRRILLLSWREKLSRKQIASQLSISPNTVKNQLAAAIRFLQDYVRKHTGKIIPISLLFSLCNGL